MNDSTPITPESVLVPPHRPLTDFYRRPEARAGYVRELFDRSAPDYDWLSRALSFGTDRAYRRRALRKAGLAPGMRVLDVATGTGLVAQAAFDLGVKSGELVGMDPSAGMLRENARRRPIRLAQGFGERLPFRSSSFDFVVMGYALRHVEDLGELFREYRRVLHPGGRLLLLEITRPRSRSGFRLMELFLGRALPRLTRALGRRQESARLLEYYWATIAECVEPGAILQALKQSGFSDCARWTTGPLLSEYVARS